MLLSWDDGVGNSETWGKVNWLVDVKVELKYWLKTSASLVGSCIAVPSWMMKRGLDLGVRSYLR